MASDRIQLKVSERTEFGSRTSRRLRREGQLPGVVYAGGSDARAFQAPERAVDDALSAGGALIDLEFEGSAPIPVVVKEQQRHPVRGSLIHLDFQEVNLTVEIESEVTIELIGAEDAPGVKNDGGVLEHVTREITVLALPTAIPESIPVDVSGMEINDTIQLSAVIVPDGVSFSADEPEEVTIATLSPPRVEEEPEPELDEEAELIGEDGEPIEREEGAEDGESEGEGESADGSGDGDSSEG